MNIEIEEWFDITFWSVNSQTLSYHCIRVKQNNHYYFIGLN